MPNIVQKQTNHGPTVPEAVFSLVEVMIAALVMVLLTVNLLALVVYAGMFRLKAKQSNETGNWIQQDLENVKLKANQFQIATLTADAAAGATSITVNRVAVCSSILNAPKELTELQRNPAAVFVILLSSMLMRS